MTWADLLRTALIEIGAQDPIDPVDGNAQTLALTHLNGLIGLFNASGEVSYTATFPSYTTTPSLSPHTIGPSGATWSATQRPMTVLAANQLLGSGTDEIRMPIAIRDADWWFSQQAMPNLEVGIITDLYYAPTYPNGSLYFWPVPDDAVVIELQVRLMLAAIAEADLGTDIALPPGYEMLLWTSLAESLVTPLTVPMPAQLPRKAELARAAVFGANLETPRIATRDSGMMAGRSTDGGYNWRTNLGGGRTW